MERGFQHAVCGAEIVSEVVINFDAVDAISAARHRVADEWQCQIVYDRGIGQEIVLKAEEHLQSISGVPAPNPFKVAGYYAFWIRKLKPCRVFSTQSFITMLDHHKIIHQVKAPTSAENLPHWAFVNEMIAVKLAFAILSAGGIKMPVKAELVHDLITSLRYHSISPNALRIVLESMV